MAKGKNSENLSDFLGMMQGMATGAQDKTLAVDFGQIVAGKALLCDSVGVAIPKGDYQRLSGVGISVGNRVLVAWVQNDAVVLGNVTGVT